MNEQEILKQETLYFLAPHDKDNSKDFRECLFRAERHNDESWDLCVLYCYDWIYEDNISNESLITDIKASKLLLECPLN